MFGQKNYVPEKVHTAHSKFAHLTACGAGTAGVQTGKNPKNVCPTCNGSIRRLGNRERRRRG